LRPLYFVDVPLKFIPLDIIVIVSPNPESVIVEPLSTVSPVYACIVTVLLAELFWITNSRPAVVVADGK
jgi:hypothetical protein